MVLTMTAGTVVVMWLAELITQRIIGQGMSVLIFTNVISGLPTQGDDLLKSAGWPKFTFLLPRPWRSWSSSCSSSSASGVSRHVRQTCVGRRMYGGQSTYIPMKLNTGGVVPIIFAASIGILPAPNFQRLPQHWLGQGCAVLDKHPPRTARQPRLHLDLRRAHPALHVALHGHNGSTLTSRPT